MPRFSFEFGKAPEKLYIRKNEGDTAGCVSFLYRITYSRFSRHSSVTPIITRAFCKFVV